VHPTVSARTCTLVEFVESLSQSRQSAGLFLQSLNWESPPPPTRRRVCPPSNLHASEVLAEYSHENSHKTVHLIRIFLGSDPLVECDPEPHLLHTARHYSPPLHVLFC
jgi:hypothetical protein